MLRTDQPCKKSVLVVDNDVWVRGALSEILIADGYVVSQASNGVTGLRLALEEPPDVILLNLALPEMDGGALLCELRSHPTTVRIPVLLLLDPCDVARRAEYPSTHGVVCRRVCATEVLAQVGQAIQPYRVVREPKT